MMVTVGETEWVRFLDHRMEFWYTLSDLSVNTAMGNDRDNFTSSIIRIYFK